MSALSNARLSRRCLGLLVAALAVFPSVGCFNSPDISKIICTSNQTCPSDYLCVFPKDNPTQGKCEKGGTAFDGGNIDLAGSFDGVFADGIPSDGASSDGASAIDSGRGVDSAAPLDSPSDRSNGSADQASTSILDGTAGSPDVLIAIDVAVVVEVQPDAALPDAPTDSIEPPVDAATADAPIQPPEAGTGCSTATDCPGPCQTCSTSSHACVAVSSQDDPSGHCSGTCDTSGACKAKQGQTCQASGTCASGLFCAPDGHCCDRACAGSCESCETGVCTAVTGAPHMGHTTCVGSSAECSGSCTGSSNGQCTWSPTACGQASCTTLTNAQSQPVGTAFVPQGTCNSGACAPSTGTSCSGGLICASATACKTTCTADGDCLTGNTCSSGICVGKKANGLVCTAANECLNGNCVDGFCCESACSGTCVACSAAKTGAGSNGLCRPVMAGTDPDTECSVDTGNQCGRDGTCDGLGACRLQVTGTTCGSPSCSNAILTPAGKCNGSGICVAATTSSACPGNFPCASSTACATTCTDRSTTGCLPGYKCIGGSTCIMATVDCGGTGCQVGNGGQCCVEDPNHTLTNALFVCLTSAAQICDPNSSSPQSPFQCNSGAECPTGQVCCYNHSSYCSAGNWQIQCAATCSNPYSGSTQVCDPSLTPTECPSGTTCQLDTCAGVNLCR